MNFLAGLGTSMFSSPLVQGVLGNLASGVVNTLKESAIRAIGGLGQQASVYGNQAIDNIKNYEPEFLPKKRKRVEYINNEEDWEDYKPARKKKMPIREKIAVKRNNNRRPYNPDLITEYEDD